MRYRLRSELENEFYQWRATAVALFFILLCSLGVNAYFLFDEVEGERLMCGTSLVEDVRDSQTYYRL